MDVRKRFKDDRIGTLELCKAIVTMLVTDLHLENIVESLQVEQMERHAPELLMTDNARK